MSQTPASPLCVLCDSVFQNDDATDNLLYRLLLAAAQEESLQKSQYLESVRVRRSEI